MEIMHEKLHFLCLFTLLLLLLPPALGWSLILGWQFGSLPQMILSCVMIQVNLLIWIVSFMLKIRDSLFTLLSMMFISLRIISIFELLSCILRWRDGDSMCWGLFPVMWPLVFVSIPNGWPPVRPVSLPWVVSVKYSYIVEGHRLLRFITQVFEARALQVDDCGTTAHQLSPVSLLRGLDTDDGFEFRSWHDPVFNFTSFVLHHALPGPGCRRAFLPPAKLGARAGLPSPILNVLPGLSFLDDLSSGTSSASLRSLPTGLFHVWNSVDRRTGNSTSLLPFGQNSRGWGRCGQSNYSWASECWTAAVKIGLLQANRRIEG